MVETENVAMLSKPIVRFAELTFNVSTKRKNSGNWKRRHIWHWNCNNSTWRVTNSTILSQNTKNSAHGTHESGAMDWYLCSQLELSSHHHPLIANVVFRFWKYRRSRRRPFGLPPRHSQNTDCLKWRSRLAPTPCLDLFRPWQVLFFIFWFFWFP